MLTIIITAITLLVVCIILVGAIIVLKKIHPDLDTVRLKPLGLAGPQAEAQFKEQINKLAKATEDESQLPLGNAIEQSLSSQEDRIKQLEKQNEILSKVVLGTSTVAISTAAHYLEPDRMAYFKQIRDQAFKHVAELGDQSDVVEYAYPLMRECSTCHSYSSGWGTCQNDNSKREPTDVCDNWVSHPKS